MRRACLDKLETYFLLDDDDEYIFFMSVGAWGLGVFLRRYLLHPRIQQSNFKRLAASASSSRGLAYDVYLEMWSAKLDMYLWRMVLGLILRGSGEVVH